MSDREKKFNPKRTGKANDRPDKRGKDDKRDSGKREFDKKDRRPAERKSSGKGWDNMKKSDNKRAADSRSEDRGGGQSSSFSKAFREYKHNKPADQKKNYKENPREERGEKDKGQKKFSRDRSYGDPSEKTKYNKDKSKPREFSPDRKSGDSGRSRDFGTDRKAGGRDETKGFSPDRKGENSRKPKEFGADRKSGDRGKRKEFSTDRKDRYSGAPKEFGSDRKNVKTESSKELSSDAKRDSRGAEDKPKVGRAPKREYRKPDHKFKKKGESRNKRGFDKTSDDGSIRLNRFIANAGVCSRREADELIKMGVISINGKIITELGTKVMPGDKVKYGDDGLQTGKMRYVLLNKPKDFITTLNDPQGRRTVMELVSSACKERIYPVGRLDRNTTGLLLFTNDGYLAEKLMHPSKEVNKLYHAETYTGVSVEDLEQLKKGVTIDEEYFIKPDSANFVGEDRHQLGIELHSGKYRVVRRMIEAVGHKVKKLDRVTFAGLTKKDLPRGKYRHLTEQEVAYLKML